MSYFPDLQFLDLEDVSKEEAAEIHGILYSIRTPRSVVLPWLHQRVDWNRQSSYEGETSECSESGTECYQTPGPPPVPVPPTSLHQVYQPQVVPAVQLSFLPHNPYYNQQPPQPHLVYEGGRRRSKASPKRSSASGTSANPSAASEGANVPPGGAGSVAPPSTYSVAPFPYHHPLVPGPGSPQFSYMGSAMQQAQHAPAGHTVYLTPFYQGPHVYSQYAPHQQVFNNPGLHPHPGTTPSQERSGKGDEGSVISGAGHPSGAAGPPPPVQGAVPPSAQTPHMHQPPPTSTSHHQVSTDIDASMAVQQGGLHMVMQNTVVPTAPPITMAQPQQEAQASEERQQPSPLPHPPIASLGNTQPLANIDTEAKVVEGQEVVGATRVAAPKSLPLNAIKTTSLPPSVAIKSNAVKPSTLPGVTSSAVTPSSTPAPLPAKEVEENGPPSPVVVPTPPPVTVVPLPTSLTPPVGSIPLGGVQPQIGMPSAQPLAPPPALPAVSPALPVPSPPVAPASVNQSKPSSWAGLFKGSGPSSSAISPQSLPPSSFMAQPTSTQPTPAPPQQPLHNNASASAPDSFQSVGKVVNKIGPMSKGPPPQNSVVVQPPPLLSSGNYHSGSSVMLHHTASSAAPPSSQQPHTHGTDIKSIMSQPSKVVHPPPGHLVANSQDPVLNRIADLLSEYEPENRAVVLTPRGLNNPSNYCYINATLQALLACAPFYNLVSTIAKHKPFSSNSANSSSTSNKSATPVIDSMIQFVSEFSVAPPNRLRKERSEKAQARREGGGVDQDPGILPGPSFEPLYVYRMVHNSSTFLQLEDRQEDAEEFLTVLLNGLNDEMIELLKLKGIGLSNGEITTNGDSHADLDNSDWKEVTNKGMSRVTRRTEVGRTPLTDIFMGQIRSRVERSDPQLSTDNIQPFYSLHLDVESCSTVDEALAKMTSEKVVEGGLSGEETTTASYIDQYPLVLILHLKCFHFSNGRLTKIAKSLDFPIDLRIGSKLMQTNKSKQYAKGTAYKLFAVVYHEGKEATKGHYLADVYHVGSSCWIRYDDAQVKSVSEQQVLKPKPPRVPYLLLYRRIDKHSRS